jgi:hypothetical protein
MCERCMRDKTDGRIQQQQSLDHTSNTYRRGMSKDASAAPPLCPSVGLSATKRRRTFVRCSAPRACHFGRDRIAVVERAQCQKEDEARGGTVRHVASSNRILPAIPNQPKRLDLP